MIGPTICRQCQKEFVASDTAYRRRTAKFCSAHCWYESRRQIPSKRKCQHCKVIIPKGRITKFCSRKCQALSRGHLVTCQYCKKEVVSAVVGKKFCSMRCRVALHHEGEEKSCTQCGKLFTKRAPSITRRNSFCSTKCARAARRTHLTSYHQEQKAHRERFNLEWREVAKVVRRRDEYVCQRCGDSDYKALSVDHIVPFRLARRLAITNPALSPHAQVNLISLCVSCHHQKTQIERYIHIGDYAAFYEWASLLVGHDAVANAMNYFGLDTMQFGRRKQMSVESYLALVKRYEGRAVPEHELYDPYQSPLDFN